MVHHVHKATEEVFEQVHVIDQKNIHPTNWNRHPIFYLFPKFENTVCSTRQVIAFWIQAVSSQQLRRGSVRATNTAGAKLDRKGLNQLASTAGAKLDRKGLNQQWIRPLTF